MIDHVDGLNGVEEYLAKQIVNEPEVVEHDHDFDVIEEAHQDQIDATNADRQTLEHYQER